MAFKIQKEIGWSYGTGQPPYKYSVKVDLICGLLNQEDDVATFSLTGSVVVVCNQNDRIIPWRASDYALLNVANNDPVKYPFTSGTEYFQRTLPFVPNAPSSYLGDILIEFRGDIFAGNSISHAVSLYVKGQGLVLPTSTTVGTHTFNINTTFSLALTGSPTQEVLIWNNSYCNSTTDYNWDNHQVWASLFDFDYRPGAIYNGTEWLSHNRSGGDRAIYTGATWQELRTEGAPTATNNPPSIYHDGNWHNMAKTGKE